MDGRVRRKDTTKGPPLRILSLDGGGVRGYSMLIILQELMHRTFVETEGRAPKRHEIPKPCEHFDLIAGTGTGGLIAIMLGRLRLDIETCKDVYVRMTKRVFETDKTIAGIPYRSTLFKASKLEEAIRECVREHTIFEDEGNDTKTGSSSDIYSPSTPTSSHRTPARSISNASRYSQIGAGPSHPRNPLAVVRWGNPNAMFYDTRENRTKCAVTAVYKGTPRNGRPILLRSYDSRKEPAPELDCMIWQAGRATCATGLAFKPIQIGQSVFLDEGAGKYNPSPQILDEAVINEYPGRECGVFISIGTGKRPPGTHTQQHLWWEGFVGSGMGEFAEARRRLMAKIEGCEETHQYMMKEHLSKRRVNPENYYRLNVEVGVGEFGMNEWNRLAEISTSTRMYLARSEVQRMNYEAATRIARIHRAKLRWERQLNGEIVPEDNRWGNKPSADNGKKFKWDSRPLPEIPPPSNPMAVELPADDVFPTLPPIRPSSQLISAEQFRRDSGGGDKIAIVSSDEYPQPVEPTSGFPPPPRSGELTPPMRYSGEVAGDGARSSMSSIIPTPRRSGEDLRQDADGKSSHYSPPPLPPKTPLPYPDEEKTPVPPQKPLGTPPKGTSPKSASGTQGTPGRSPAGLLLPYPDNDGPPPVVNRLSKPEFGVR